MCYITSYCVRIGTNIQFIHGSWKVHEKQKQLHTNIAYKSKRDEHTGQRLSFDTILHEKIKEEKQHKELQGMTICFINNRRCSSKLSS